jgi:hypothetical protein
MYLSIHCIATDKHSATTYNISRGLPEGYQRATRGLPEGYQKATRRLPEGFQEATRRLPGGYQCLI